MTSSVIIRLVHFEVFTDVRYAIAREKEIKGWRREKKIWLIQKRNPRWMISRRTSLRKGSDTRRNMAQQRLGQ